jgi:zinc and cadmium transporter
MNHPSLWLVLAISLAGDITVFISSTILLTHNKTVAWLAKYATPFAAGALLAAAFLDFLHDGAEHYEALTVMTAALTGVLFFFLLEGWLHWFHHHSKEPFEDKTTHQHKGQPIVVLVTTGNWLHNFIDGAAIAAAFLVSVNAGLVTTVAVAFHEIPREMADSGYLLKRGMSRLKVIGVHGVAIVVTAIGTLLFYLTARENKTLLAWLIGSTAGFFIYVASSDIIPSINETREKSKLIDWQVALVLLGALLVGSVILIAHHFIPE